MNSILEFRPFPKLARLSRDCVITEKLDGTNAQVVVVARTPELDAAWHSTLGLYKAGGDFYIRAGSRNRWIHIGDDNYGFASWVHNNSEDLVKLGVGQHFGEWWGAGIQRNYALKEKRFSLFNTGRWLANHGDEYGPGVKKVICDEPGLTGIAAGPDCCYVVPTLYKGEFDTRIIDNVIDELRARGSFASPGFDNPEGIVIFHAASGQLFKKTCEHDESPKTLPGLTNPAQLVAGVEAAQQAFNSNIKS